ncbi:hypothetical protein IWX76_000056 [Pedobacter sp. CAN_A7]|uniref:hypothetical protein n=1 Tax=Pedobacter sp. CAN_A7 TaxID=2787722 RepID=UPI0018CAF526
MLEGDPLEHEFSQRLPLYELEEAIKYYMEDQRVEIDTDLLLTSVQRNANTFTTKKSSDFSLPEKRFMVRFVKSFYDYLLVESPPGQFDLFPSLRYYEIIGVMLIRSGFFYNQMIEERFATEKVKQWHELSLKT